MYIAVEAGHGGRDGGACNGSIKESNINLFIGFQLKYLLEQAGHKVLMIRGDDSYISLDDRVKSANKEKVDRYISVHCNAAENTSVTGFEVWFYTQVEWAKKTAVALSEALVGRINRGVKRCSGYGGQNPSSDGGPLHVLINTQAPAILVECEFISNDEACMWLCESANRKLVAEAIYKSILP